ncbi:MAG TPA: response regulator [bacterium]
MIVLCPKCKSKLKIDDLKIKPEGIRVKCPRCSNILLIKKKVQPQPSVTLPSAKRAGAKILIAHESAIFRNNIKNILFKEGYVVLESQDGANALKIIEEQQPDVAVLDVMLASMFGFEIAEMVKKDERLKGTKIILIGDVYDKTRLRREPQSYYGADGYIEKPNVLSNVLETINKILSAPSLVVEKKPVEDKPPVALPPGVLRPAVPPQNVASDEEMQEHERAKRLAKLIVSDIALYNPKIVDEGIKNNTFFQILDKDIKQAHKLYNEKVTESLRKKTDYLHIAFEEFIKNKKKQLEQ